MHRWFITTLIIILAGATTVACSDGGSPTVPTAGVDEHESNGSLDVFLSKLLPSGTW